MRAAEGAALSLSLLVALLCAALCAAEPPFPFAKDGVVDPAPHYQRWRLSEYRRWPQEHRAFFQWRYFTLKSLETGRYFALTYGAVYDATDPAPAIPYEGAYMMFAEVDTAAGSAARWVQYEKYDVGALDVQGDYDLSLAGGKYSLQALDDSTFRLVGVMNDSAHAWAGDLPVTQTPHVVQWNVTLHRIYGWFAQADVEPEACFVGWIMWDTYAHDCEVEGSVTVDGTVYEFERSVAYRAYGDSNWGSKFPNGPDPIEYPWGWYYVQVPSADLREEISIIMGIGLVYNKDPFFGTALGAFGDIRLGNDTHVGVRYMRWWEMAPYNRTVWESTNDGTVYAFNITYGAWTDYCDEWGCDSIPLQQILVVETSNTQLRAVFTSKPDNYNRLLFPSNGFIFSDFEGLGCTVDVEVLRYGQPVLQTTVNNGGLEFGYHAPIKAPGRLAKQH